MEFLKIVALHGPNRWAAVPVLEVTVDLGDWRNRQVHRAEQFRKHLESSLPVLSGQTTPVANVQQAQAVAAAGRCAELLVAQLRIGGGWSTVLEHVTRCLHALTGVAVDYGETHETDDPAVELVTFQFEEEALARVCLETARQLCRAATQDQPFDLAAAVRKLIDLADDVRLGPSSRAIVWAAVARGIPYRRLTSGSLVQLGEGNRQRRIWTAESDATSAIAEQIASDKELTKRLLRAVGVPVPGGRPVSNAEDAWSAACEIGLPVAVKPRDANHGRGISLDLSTREQVLVAYDHALAESERGVLVERFATGQHHRLLVVGQRCIAATRGESEYITGDGRRTIVELVEEVNRDPRRGENYSDALDVLNLNQNALLLLKKQGFSPESAPAAGTRVLVQYQGDLTTDETAQVHSRNAAHAVLAAQVVGLDIAGLDVIAEDISRPFEEQGGVIVEVNAGPSLSMHVTPLHGAPQPVGEAIVDLLFAPGENGRIPIIAVTGGGARAAVAACIDSLLRAAHWKVGLANSHGVFFAGERIAASVASDRENIQTLLLHPHVAAAVFESRPEQASAEGLGCSRVDVAVIVAGESTPTDVGLEMISETAELPSGVVAVARAVPPAGFAIVPHEYSTALVSSGVCCGTVVTYLIGDDDSSRRPTLHFAECRDSRMRLSLADRTLEVELPPLIADCLRRRTTLLASVAAVAALGLSIEDLRVAVAGAFPVASE